MITATFFQDGARKYFPIIEEGKVYEMSGGSVKMANKRFTTIKNDYQLNFDERAEVKEIFDNQSVIKSGTVFSFTPLVELKNQLQSNQLVEVIGVVIEDQGVLQIQIRSTGEYRDKRSITLADESGISVGATLWGECSGAHDIQIGHVMAVKGAKLSDYGGVSLNIDDNSSHIEINPMKIERANVLMKWYQKQAAAGNGAIATESLTHRGEGGVNLNQLPFSFIKEMTETLMNDHDFLNSGDQNNTQYFKINGTLIRIAGTRQMWYTACPECKKKVMPADNFGGGQTLYSCERCAKTFNDCNYAYNFSCKLGDLSESVFVSCLGESPADEIVGLTAK